ncbi:hypothetical protein [Caulobacter sp. RL271]|jgi:hypothetical protein|uniref:Uncharacterized protein n=1 Tax=Caulobacter segnis TaxID=88688 RepID=A0ABY4ZVC5_9CAUL|nr:hypothetical protein [Caulobacter segnis]USQ96635.1 hypothetical protein MZV50_03325 [Caulobacter segnis]
MTAIACLRILFTADGESQPGDIPKHKAQGVADAFLKARWRAPRKCGAVAPLAFVVADHHVEHLDPTEVQGLAAELEKVLFPGRPIGQIALMTFEGDEQAVLKFASLSQKALKGLLNGEGYGGEPGRVHVITADSIEPLPATRAEAKVHAEEKAAEKKSGLAAATTIEREPASAKAAAAPAPVVPVVEPAKAEAPPAKDGPPIVKPEPGKAKPQPSLATKLAAKVEPPPPPPAETGWWGIYDLAEGVFVGSAIGMRADLIGPPPEDDSKLLKRDLIALTDAQGQLKTAKFGEIHVPFGFWNLTTPASQDAYKTRLSRYPLDQQPRLVATVYGTPREASIGMLQQARAFLQGSFAQMDVRITDPTFPLSGLPPELVDTITLVLDGETDHDRLKQILKFVERKSQYVAKGVRQVVANVTSDVELEACKAGGITRVQGPAVTDLLDKPVASAEGAPVALARNAA